MANEEFPAINWLGYSIDMTAPLPMTIRAATSAVISARRLISYSLYDTRPYIIDGVTYDVPKQIGVATDDTGNAGSFVTYPSGDDASVAFRADSNLPLSFFAVVGEPSVAAATDKIFRRTNQYAFFGFNQGRYSASLYDYVDLLNENVLLKEIRKLPMPFNGENKPTVQTYRDFFQRIGTHVIIKAKYGARLQLNAWAATTNSAVNAAWVPDVCAEFGGIPSGGNYDPNIHKQSQYTEFSNLLQNAILAVGGDKVLSAGISINPRDYKEFQEWTKSAHTKDKSIVTLVVTELWSLMMGALDEELNDAAPSIQKAFEHIAFNPDVYKTAVTLDVHSDWAEFGLLTPNAVIVKGSEMPTNTRWNETKLTWGREHSHDYHRQTIKFFVVNDGYPIDFYISHGSNGSTVGSGNAQIIMEGNNYENFDITDNNWNTKWFYQGKVSPKPEKFQSRRKHKDLPDQYPSYRWDDLLQEYLDQLKLGSESAHAGEGYEDEQDDDQLVLGENGKRDEIQ